MPFKVAISDALNRRVGNFSPGKMYAFQLAVSDVVKGRATGEQVHISPASQREFYMLRRYEYALYYSIDPRFNSSLVFEEFLNPDEEELILDAFSGEAR